MKKTKVISGSSPKVKNLSARLEAVQAVYQSTQSGKDIKSVLEQHIARLQPSENDAKAMVEPDGALLQKILLGVKDRRNDLEAMIVGASKRQDRVVEPLLMSILLCAAYELVGNMEVDAPIIINDYLNVTHSFYEQGEVSLINGMLDSIAKTVRV